MEPGHLDVERVKEILDEALKLPTAERPAFLSTACGDDQALREEVESLLGQDTGQVPLLEKPMFSLLEDSGEHEVAPWHLKPGQKIGPYRVVRQLGEGGMGAVALAARADDFEKRVALKVIKTTLLSSELVERFHNERQILAFLEHPNIARILDGGTTEAGLPYFVMEYVEGEPIDDYCQHHALPIRERLEIFLELCSALQLAHQNLVVHRDLKPHNVLVTADGVPKLLDFGIAKRLTPEPAAHAITQLAQGPMTLKYASPEQINNQPITTASDIYALGVLLYELLTDRYPYNEESELDLAKAICDKEPPKPSSVLPRRISSNAAEEQPSRRSTRQWRRQLAGDLDSIVLKALEKNPRLRYSSVEQLADDVRRHLDALPVLAREGTWIYRTGKLIRRNKGRLAATAALGGLLVAFGVQQIRLERTQASQLLIEEEARQAEAQADVLQEFVDRLFSASDPDIAQGQNLRVQDVLEKAEPKIREDLADEPELFAENLENLGRIYRRLGRRDLALRLTNEAYQARRRFHGGHRDHLLMARNLNNLATVYYDFEEYRRAELLYQEVLAMRRRLGQTGTDLAPTQGNLAAIYLITGRNREARELYCEVFKARKEAHGMNDVNVSKVMSDLGKLAYSRGDFVKAEAWLRPALDILRSAEEARPKRLASDLSTLGRTLHGLGRLDEAEAAYREALVIRQRIGGGEDLVAVSQKDLAAWSCSVGRLGEARDLIDEALATLSKTREPDSWILAEAKNVKGNCLVAAGRYAEAEPHLLASYEVLSARRGNSSIYTLDALRSLIKLYESWGKPEEAAPYHDLLDENERSLDEQKENPGDECTPPGL